MRLRSVFSTLMSVALITFAGCESNEEQQSAQAELTLDTTELIVGSEGGDCRVKYTLKNPQDGAVVLANCTESWIEALSTAMEGNIIFRVAPNYKDVAREARIKVSYTAIDTPFEIVVKQEASTISMFEYKVTNNGITELTLDITPADLSSAYICQIHSQEYIDTFGLSDDNALIFNDSRAFAGNAEALGQSYLNYLQNITYRGEAKGVTFEGLTPDTDYVVYSYYMDLTDGQAISEVYRKSLRTAKPQSVEVSFEMSFEVEGAQIKQTITPSNDDVYYYVDFMSAEDFNAYYGAVDAEETFVNRWNENVTMKNNQGYYAYQILEEYGRKGKQTIEYTTLEADTEYLFYIFALNSDTAFVASDIILKRVSTESAQASGVTIEITVEDIYATTANVYWVASDPEGWFARSVFTKAEFNALGATDEQRFATIAAQDMSFYEAKGETDMNLSNLQPNTTYVAFAYGLDGATPNTQIFTKEFTTKSNATSTSNIQMTLGAHFTLSDVAAVDAEHWSSGAGKDDYALVPVTISGVTTSDEIYWLLTTFPTDYYNYDDEWIRDLASNENNRHNYYSNCYFQIPYEKEYSLIAVAKDANGNFGKLFKLAIYLTKSDAADVSTYVYVEEK